MAKKDDVVLRIGAEVSGSLGRSLNSVSKTFKESGNAAKSFAKDTEKAEAALDKYQKKSEKLSGDIDKYKAIRDNSARSQRLKNAPENDISRYNETYYQIGKTYGDSIKDIAKIYDDLRAKNESYAKSIEDIKARNESLQRTINVSKFVLSNLKEPTEENIIAALKYVQVIDNAKDHIAQYNKTIGTQTELLYELKNKREDIIESYIAELNSNIAKDKEDRNKVSSQLGGEKRKASPDQSRIAELTTIQEKYNKKIQEETNYVKELTTQLNQLKQGYDNVKISIASSTPTGKELSATSDAIKKATTTRDSAQFLRNIAERSINTATKQKDLQLEASKVTYQKQQMNLTNQIANNEATIKSNLAEIEVKEKAITDGTAKAEQKEQELIQNANHRTDQLLIKLKQIAEEFGIDEKTFEEFVNSYNEKILQAENKQDDLKNKSDDTLKEMGQRWVELARQITSSFTRGVARDLKNVFKTITKLGKQLSKVFVGTKENTMSLAGAVRLLVQYGLGFRSLYYLVRRFRSGIEEGFGYLSNYASEVKSSINQLSEALYYMKSAAASALAPFMTIINSILPKIISLFNQASIAIANFIATFTGAKQIYVAKTNLDAYAGALDSVSGSAEEAKNELLGFDTITKLTDTDTSSSGGSSGSDLGSDWFDTQNVEPNSFAQMLIDAFNNSDFTEVGRVIGEKLRDALESIDWGFIYMWVGNIATDIATFINGFISVDRLANDIGSTIAKVINGVGYFVYRAIKVLNWDDLGVFLNDAITQFLTDFDAKLFGNALHDLIVNIIGVIETILDGDAGTLLGQKIGDFLSRLDIPDLASKLLELAGKIASAIGDALKAWAETDPESFGLGIALVTAIAGANLVTAIAGALAPIISEAMSKTLGTMLAPKLATLFSGGMSGVVDSLATSFGGIISTLSDFILPVTLAIAAIVALVASFVDAYNNSEELKESIQSIWDKLSSFGSFVANLVTSVWNDDILPIWEAIKGVVVQLQDEVLTPLWEIISEVVNSVIEMLTTIVEPRLQIFYTFVKTIFAAIKVVIASLLAIIKQGIEVVSSVIDDIKTILQGLIDFLTGIFSGNWKLALQGILEMGAGMINALISVVELGANKVLEGIQNMVNGAIDLINEMIQGISALASLLNINIGTVAHVSWASITLPRVPVPELAQGAVIPPNRQFLAMLGDQTSGTNIEAPLDTIKQALAEVMTESSQEVNINFTGSLSQLARVLQPKIEQETRRRGLQLAGGR